MGTLAAKKGPLLEINLTRVTRGAGEPPEAAERPKRDLSWKEVSSPYKIPVPAYLSDKSSSVTVTTYYLL